MQTRPTQGNTLYLISGLVVTLVTAAIFVALSNVLLASGIGDSEFNIGVAVVIAILILSPLEAEIHERLHFWGFRRAGVPADQVTIIRPTLSSALGLGSKEQPKWWRSSVARPITRDAYRSGLLASLWIVPLGGVVGAIAFGLIGQAAWQSTALLGAMFVGMVALLGTLRDVFTYVLTLDAAPNQMFKVG